MGIVSITSKPPGELYIDGKSTGMTTPVRGLSVEAGYHKVKIKYANTKTFSTEKRALIKPAEEVKIFFRQ